VASKSPVSRTIPLQWGEPNGVAPESAPPASQAPEVPRQGDVAWDLGRIEKGL